MVASHSYKDENETEAKTKKKKKNVRKKENRKEKKKNTEKNKERHLRLGRCCVELHYGPGMVLRTLLLFVLGFTKLRRKMGQNSSVKTVLSTVKARPQNGQIHASIQPPSSIAATEITLCACQSCISEGHGGYFTRSHSNNIAG